MTNIIYINIKTKKYKRKFKKIKEVPEVHTTKTKISGQKNKLKLQENREAHHQKTRNPHIHHHAKKNPLKKRDKDQPHVGQNNKSVSNLPDPLKPNKTPKQTLPVLA
jgi:hypothetical protein